MSKAFSLAGLRLGWITGPAELLHAVSVHRDYNTISVGMLDDRFAALALEHTDAVLRRNRGIVRGNLAVLDAWVEREPRISYVKPGSGTTALLRFDAGLHLTRALRAAAGGGGRDAHARQRTRHGGYLRIGDANHPEVLREGLERFSGFLRSLA